MEIADFNPRSPRGERRRRLDDVGDVRHFNPRSPRGERLRGEGQEDADRISIHAPRVGSDEPDDAFADVE